jgi:hypothetical protein
MAVMAIMTALAGKKVAGATRPARARASMMTSPPFGRSVVHADAHSPKRVSIWVYDIF